jgi:protein disulfide-isomerase A1
MRPLAKKYQEYLSFVTIDAVEYASLAHALGLSPGAFPALVVQNPILGQVFLYDQTRAITTDSVEAFILDIVQGKIQPNGLKNEGTTHTEL